MATAVGMTKVGCSHQLLLGPELQVSTTVRWTISGCLTPLCCRQNQALHTLCRSPSQLQGVQQPQMPCSLNPLLQASSPAAHSLFGCAPMPAVSDLILPESTVFCFVTLLQIVRRLKALVHTVAGSINQGMRTSCEPANSLLLHISHAQKNTKQPRYANRRAADVFPANTLG